MQSIETLEDLIPLSPLARWAIDYVREEMVSDPGHDESHLVRVARNALMFGEGGDVDVIIVASVLHDLVNVLKDDPARASASLLSANRVRITLLRNNLGSEEFADKVHHAIHAHSFSANVKPTTLEAMAVQDADRIESLGHIGLARLFTVNGSLRRAMWHPTDPLAENRELDDLKYGLDHFAVKLAKLSETMQTVAGRNEARDKTLSMAMFIVQLIAQIEGVALTQTAHERIFERVIKFGNLNVERLG